MDGEDDLIRALIVLTIKDFKKDLITAETCERFLALFGFFVDAGKLPEKVFFDRRFILK